MQLFEGAEPKPSKNMPRPPRPASYWSEREVWCRITAECLKERTIWLSVESGDDEVKLSSEECYEALYSEYTMFKDPGWLDVEFELDHRARAIVERVRVDNLNGREGLVIGCMDWYQGERAPDFPVPWADLLVRVLGVSAKDLESRVHWTLWAYGQLSTAHT